MSLKDVSGGVILLVISAASIYLFIFDENGDQVSDIY